MTEPSRRIAAAILISFVLARAIGAGWSDVGWGAPTPFMRASPQGYGAGLRDLIECAVPIMLVYVVSVTLSGSRWKGLASALSLTCLSLVVSRGALFDQTPLMTSCFLLALWFSALWYQDGLRRWLVAMGILVGVVLAGSPVLRGGGVVVLILLGRGVRRYSLSGSGLVTACFLFIASTALGTVISLEGPLVCEVSPDLNLATQLSLGTDVRTFLLSPSVCLLFLVSGLVVWGMFRKERVFSAGVPLLAVSAIAPQGLSYSSGMVIGPVLPFAAMMIAETMVTLWRRAL